MGIALSGGTFGKELAYAEIVLDYTTTNTDFTGPTPAGGLITGLEVNITGYGRPVDFELYFPFIRHSTSNQPVYVQLAIGVDGGTQQINNATTGGQILGQSGPSGTTGRSAFLRRRLVIPSGQVWKVTPQVAAGVAGTVTVNASAAWPTTFTATGR